MMQEVQEAEGLEAEAGAEVADQFAEADAQADPNEGAEPSIDEVASEMGWVPKDKFKGPADKWKPASQFIRDGKNIQERLSRDVKSLRDTLDTVSKTSGQILADKLQEQHRMLSERYAAAVEKGDPDEAFAAANEIMRVKAAAQPARAAPAPETDAWVSKNSRVMNDPLAAQRALQICDAYARAGQSVPDQLANTEAVMKREFPHLFDDKPAPAVATPGRGLAAPRTGKTAADLPKEARAIAEDMAERGMFPSPDDYARHYFAALAKKG